MPDSLKAVFFDVDGVLLDSLPQHLQICRDKAEEYGLHLDIPSVAQFRRLIGRGIKVSPMLEFFRAVGFPERDARRAVVDYQNEFMRCYRPALFAGAAEMLATLHSLGFRLGIVTSNLRANVVPALGQAISFFDESCLFYLDRYSEPRSKAWCLSEGANILGIDAGSCVYVGDQPVDWFAAKAARMRFLGVTYGWGFERQSDDFPTADTIVQIVDKITAMKNDGDLEVHASNQYR